MLKQAPPSLRELPRIAPNPANPYGYGSGPPPGATGPYGMPPAPLGSLGGGGSMRPMGLKAATGGGNTLNGNHQTVGLGALAEIARSVLPTRLITLLRCDAISAHPAPLGERLGRRGARSTGGGGSPRPDQCHPPSMF
jgi:hypothetical protein